MQKYEKYCKIMDSIKKETDIDRLAKLYQKIEYLYKKEYKSLKPEIDAQFETNGLGNCYIYEDIAIKLMFERYNIHYPTMEQTYPHINFD